MASDTDTLKRAKTRTGRLKVAEATGLRLAVLCRTVAVIACAVWFFSSYQTIDQTPRLAGAAALAIFVAIGFVYYPLIGTRWDHPAAKYALYAFDILLLCALFVVIPVSRADDVPQIIAFRGYGIYYLLPFIALACLSLSWGLVAWSGIVTAIGWWLAFAYVVSQMDETLSWGDLPASANVEDYERVFLSINFIGIGSRVEETGFVLILSTILAVAVYRARSVFFAQIQAEDDREHERAARERVTRMLGQYVPESIAERLLQDQSSLEPSVRDGTALIMDIENFSSFASARQAQEVIEILNEYLAQCADEISGAGGVVISYLGDGLLATFNTPLPSDNPADAALDAAHALLQTTQTRTFRGHRFKLRIGIATGHIASGIVGSSDRQAFTVYGKTVNRAARLEQLNKTVGTRILIDQATRDMACENDHLDFQGDHVVRGTPEPVPVWSPGFRGKT